MKLSSVAPNTIGILFSLLVFFQPEKAMTQTYGVVDSLSASYFEQGDWQNLNRFFSHVDLKQYRSHIFYRRSAIAHFSVGNYTRADRMIRRAVKLNACDSFTNALRHDMLLMKGEVAQAIFVGRAQRGYDRYALLSDLSMDAGVKLSSMSEPGHLQHYALSAHSRIGYATHVRQFVSFNQQKYFWEDFRQFTYTFLGTHLLSPVLSLEMPFQLADYKSKIEHEAQINESDIFMANGSAMQQALHWGMNMRYEGSSFALAAGFSWLQADTEAGFDAEYRSGGDVFPSRVDSSDYYTQWQGNIAGQLSHRIGKRRLKLQLRHHFIQSSNGFFLNFRPSAAIELSKKFWLYAEYWHKDRHMLAAPDAGIFINNFNTKTNRVLGSLQYFPSGRIKLEGTWFMESGRDLLYNRDLDYQSFFVHLTYYLKP